MTGTRVDAGTNLRRGHRPARGARLFRAAGVVALLSGLAVTLGAGPAEAQSDDAARAKAQFVEGQAAVEKGDLGRARVLFLSSKELFAAAGTLLNLADCEEKLGLFASAEQHYRDAVVLLPKGDGRLAFADGRLAALGPRVPRLRIDVVPGVAGERRVLLDGRELPPASLGVELPLDPGSYRVSVLARGREDRTYRIQLTEAKRQNLSVEAGFPKQAVSSGIAGEEATLAAPGGRSGSSTLRIVGFTLGGVGLAGVVGGAIAGGFWFLDSAPYDINKGGGGSAVGIFLVPLGALLTCTGIGLVTYSFKRSAVNIQAGVGPGGAGLSLGGSF